MKAEFCFTVDEAKAALLEYYKKKITFSKKNYRTEVVFDFDEGIFMVVVTEMRNRVVPNYIKILNFFRQWKVMRCQKSLS